MTEFRFLPSVKGNGKLDAWRTDWRAIKPDPDNDLRDLTTPENRKFIEELKVSIEQEGVKFPLEVRKDHNDEIWATDGRCRLTALAELEAEGRQVPKTVLVLPEPSGTSREDRTVNMLVQGTQRKNYDDFEVARGVKRLQDFGWSHEKICERMRWKSVGTVKNHLDSLTLKPELRDMVLKGKISRTEALRLQRMTPDADPGEIMKGAEEEHARLHKKGPVKIKPRHVKQATKAKAKPPAEPPQQEQEPEHAQPPETETAAPVVPSPSPSVVATPPQPLPGISEDRTEPPAGDAERDQGVVHVIPSSANGMKAIADALLPLARMAEVTDLDELGDDHVLEISVRDVKRGAAAWRRITGQASTAGGEEIAA